MHYYDLIDTGIANGIMSSFTDVELEKDGLVKLWNTYFTKSKVNGKMRYIDMPNPEYTIGALCIEITDIKYSNGIYTVTFTYCYPTSQDEIDNKVEDLPVYEMTLGLTMNEDQTYSKYRVSSMMESKLIKEGKIDTNNENIQDGNSGETVEDNNTGIAQIDESLKKFIGEWHLEYVMQGDVEYPISSVRGNNRTVTLTIKDDGTFTETVQDAEKLTGKYIKISDNVIKRIYDDGFVVYTTYETNQLGEIVIYNICKSDQNKYEYYIKETNVIKESLIGIWWRTFNVDHDEENKLSIQFTAAGKFTELTMQEADANGVSSSKKTGEGTYRITQNSSFDIVELTYNNGEVHELLYGLKGTAKDDQTKLHYSAGRQVFTKFTYVTQ